MSPTDEAIEYLTTCCRNIGAFTGTGAPYTFLKNVAIQIKQSKSSLVFPERHKEYVAYAVKMVASNLSLSPPAAIASLYLATRFEYYFRILSGKLNGDGTWIPTTAKSAVQAAIGGKKLSNRVSDVSLAYKIMLLNASSPFVQQCIKIDSCLYKKPCTVAGGKTICNIGERIAFSRHSASHGYLGDISFEAVFYGLLTGIVFYNQA